jgi:hypothetical protein
VDIGHDPDATSIRLQIGACIFGRVLKQIAQRVADGETVMFRPTGNSMVPLINSRDEVVVAPVDPTRIEVGDIVLTMVAGTSVSTA